jgi:hypothetical protein
MKGQTVVNLVVLVQVLPNRVDDKAKEIGVLVHQQRNGEISLVMATEIETLDTFS